VRRRCRRIAKLDDVVAAGVQDVWIVAGKTEHTIAIVTQQPAHSSSGVAVIEVQALLGLLLADRTDTLLPL